MEVTYTIDSMIRDIKAKIEEETQYLKAEQQGSEDDE
jgi:hypothetical protein